jgi:hypothetical protein
MSKICKNCNESKEYSEYTKGRGACKICRNSNKMSSNRDKLRKELRELIILDNPDHPNYDWIDKKYVKIEVLNQMKNQKDRYDFCEIPTFLRKKLLSHHKPSLDKGYFLDWMLISDNIDHITYMITII